MSVRIELARARSRRAIPGAGDAVWEILLDIADAGALKTSAVGAATAIAPTTALRHIRSLEISGLIQRRGDPSDGRYTIISLTDAGRAAVERCLV